MSIDDVSDCTVGAGADQIGWQRPMSETCPQPGGELLERSGDRPRYNVAALVDDAVMMVLLVCLLPLFILLVGAPVALLVRLLLEIAKVML
jgi:hypothetical protein